MLIALLIQQNYISNLQIHILICIRHLLFQVVLVRLDSQEVQDILVVQVTQAHKELEQRVILVSLVIPEVLVVQGLLEVQALQVLPALQEVQVVQDLQALQVLPALQVIPELLALLDPLVTLALRDHKVLVYGL